MRAAVVAGAGAYLPPKLVTNQDMAERFETSDEWIRTRTGMSVRHVVEPGTATSDLAVEAGLRALKSAEAGGAGGGADMVILTTTTPDHPVPSTAPDIASRLGLGVIPAFDMSAVCRRLPVRTGQRLRSDRRRRGHGHPDHHHPGPRPVHRAGHRVPARPGRDPGLRHVGGVRRLPVRTGRLRDRDQSGRVLLIGADAFTTFVDPEDRTTAVLFGDGAGAVLLRAGDPDEPGAVGRPVLGSDGTLKDLLIVPAGGSRQRSAGPLTDPGQGYFKMNGRETYRHAVQRMSESSRQAVAAAGWTCAEVDRFAAHQANSRILGAVADDLGIPHEKRLSNVAEVGNTAVASLPLLLAQAAAGWTVSRPATGSPPTRPTPAAGLSWGAATLTWPDIHVV
ncbi:3-oxoacyl-[acyl-carrier-protein] synthase III C-terminal domain-containing protein [Streptomyces hypolithicus]